MALRLRAGLRVEEIDGEVVVLDRAGAAAHRFTGDAGEVIRRLENDVEPSEVPEHLVAAFDEVVASGVVANPAHWSRRKVLLAGGAAAWTAATISSFGLSLPAAAQASSECAGGEESDGAVSLTEPGETTYTTGPGQTTLLVRAWGGGGGGGGGWNMGMVASGAGGGGGQYSYNEALPVSACQMYVVTVGDGGVAGVGQGNGGAGGTSFFGATTTFAANGGGAGVHDGAPPTGGMGGTPGAGGISHQGGSGGAPSSGRGGGGGGGGAGGHSGAGGAGVTGIGGSGVPPVDGGTGGAGTPGGGAGGSGGGESMGANEPAGAGVAPGGAGGGGGTGSLSGAGAAGALWVDI